MKTVEHVYRITDGVRTFFVRAKDSVEAQILLDRVLVAEEGYDAAECFISAASVSRVTGSELKALPTLGPTGVRKETPP